MKVLIVDDEPIARRGLRRELGQMPGVTCVGECGGRDEAVRAIRDRHRRIMVLMTHNTDVGDSFEREREDSEYSRLFSPPGYALGINVLLYAMTQ